MATRPLRFAALHDARCDSLTQGSPFPDEQSLAETATMPQQADDNPAIRRIK
jgi:hypothetical protein